MYEIIGGMLIFLSSLVGEQMPASWKKRSYLIFALLALGYVAIGVLLDRDTAKEQGKLEQTIADLKRSVTNEEKATSDARDESEKRRQSDRDAFLKQFDALSKQVSDIRTNVRTESLRKQLDDTQRSLRETQQALERREVRLGVVINGQNGPSAVTVKPERIPNSNIGAYPLGFALANGSNEDAASGMVEVVCSDCKGLRFASKDAWPYWGAGGLSVGRDFLGVPKHSMTALGALYLISDSGSFPKQVQVAVRYRCLLCVPEESKAVTVNFAQ
jgi:hypothetical protein